MRLTDGYFGYGYMVDYFAFHVEEAERDRFGVFTIPLVSESSKDGASL